MKRIVDVIRIQVFNGPWLLVWPLAILGLTLVLNMAIFAAIGDIAPPDDRNTGALSSIYLVIGISHLQTMTQVFPFALGFSVTRRAFYSATALLVTAQSLFFGLVVLALSQVELLTAGWGVEMRFFGVSFLVQDGLIAQWLVYTVPFLAISALFVFTGVVFKRWGQTGIFVGTVGVLVLIGTTAIVVTWQRWWPEIGAFFTEQSSLALFAGYPLLVALVLGVAGWLAIRRATP